jgi:hypothetical protein
VLEAVRVIREYVWYNISCKGKLKRRVIMRSATYGKPLRIRFVREAIFDIDADMPGIIPRHITYEEGDVVHAKSAIPGTSQTYIELWNSCCGWVDNDSFEFVEEVE